MFVLDNLQELDVVSVPNFPNTKFLLMFLGVVIGPIVLFAVGGRTPNTLWQFGLVWTLLAMGLLFMVSAGVGLAMFKNNSYSTPPPSIGTNFS